MHIGDDCNKRSKRSVCQICAHYLLVGLILSLMVLPSCSNKSKAKDVAQATEDRLSDALDFTDGEQVEGEAPQGSGAPENPQVRYVKMPEEFRPGASFRILLGTDFEPHEKVKRAIIRVKNANKYFIVEGELQPLFELTSTSDISAFQPASARIMDTSNLPGGRMYGMDIEGGLDEDYDPDTDNGEMEFAFQTEDGGTGKYTSNGFQLTEAPPECTSGPCCNGGKWMPEGESCISERDDSACTDDRCDSEHRCVAIPVDEGAFCDAGLGDRSGRCLEGECVRDIEDRATLALAGIETRAADGFRVVDGEAPQESGSLAPQITRIQAPQALRPEARAIVRLFTDFATGQIINGAVIQIEGATKHLIYNAPATVGQDGNYLDILFQPNITEDVQGYQYLVKFALTTTIGEIGDYVEHQFTMPFAEKECELSFCCNGGQYIEVGGLCLYPDDIACTKETCNASHECVTLIEESYCLIKGTCYEDAVTNPDNVCAFCQSEKAWESWSKKPDETACRRTTGEVGYCIDGRCKELPDDIDGDIDYDLEEDIDTADTSEEDTQETDVAEEDTLPEEDGDIDAIDDAEEDIDEIEEDAIDETDDTYTPSPPFHLVAGAIVTSGGGGRSEDFKLWYSAGEMMCIQPTASERYSVDSVLLDYGFSPDPTEEGR